MDKSMFDRWTDTTTFRAMLLAAAIMVLPVLGVGVIVTSITIAGFFGASTLSLDDVGFCLLAIGGTVGMLGYIRAHLAYGKPQRHNIAATLICLGVGAVTAVAVAAAVLVQALDLSSTSRSWSPDVWVVLAAAFAAANVVWAISGLGWMQRLPRRYAEQTGRRYDTVPVILLFVSFTLGTAATLLTVAS